MSERNAASVIEPEASKSVTTTLLLPVWLHFGIRSLAQLNDRSFSAEVRSALRQHLLNAPVRDLITEEEEEEEEGA